MKIKKGYIFMALGILLIIGAVSLATYNHIDDKRAGEEAHSAYEQLYEVIDKNINNNLKNEASSPSATPESVVQEMKTEKINGREYIGVVSIPAMNVELPVQSSCNDANLKFSPCCYSGNVFDGSLIIAAHNYVTHFGRLGTLQSGDKVSFTDVDGLTYNYKVVELYSLDYLQVDEMKKQGKWDLTLFTCTYGNRYRITVRCIRV